MKDLTAYIFEKYKISKKSKLKLTWPEDKKEIEAYIRKKVKQLEDKEIYLSDIFRNKKYDKDKNVIDSIYYEGSLFSYSYYKDYERTKAIKNLDDVFSPKDIEKIYNYFHKKEDDYIVEKFKISKKSSYRSPRTEFIEGEKVLRLEYLSNKSSKDSDTLNIEVHIFEEFITDESLYLKSEYYYRTPKCFINTEGYWEYNHQSSSEGKYLVLFINKEDGKIFLEQLTGETESDKPNIGLLLENYYDEKDTNDIVNKKLEILCSNIDNLIEELD